ncbi:hypothetical protein F5B20DRAFT_589995 [Whalleya microplaca]|nr:hypothetical protein F5B20DRAFT_589995 [Whalleya microplaca]
MSQTSSIVIPPTPASTQHPCPPRYTTENITLERSPEKDQKAIDIATFAYKALAKCRRKARETRSHGNDGTTDNHAALLPVREEDQQAQESLHGGAYGNHDGSSLSIKSMYDGTGKWPKKVKQGKQKKGPVSGSTQHSFTNIGFPDDRSLVVGDFEDNTHIDTQEPSVVQLAQDIINIKTKPAPEIADSGSFQEFTEYGRKIETFKLNGRAVTKATFDDADVYGKIGKPYNDLPTSKSFEREISNNMGDKPSLGVEQWVTSQVLLCLAGQIGGRTDDYWKKARDLAQQQLYLDEQLDARARKEIDADSSDSKDASFSKMLSIRDEYAVTHGLFHHVKADIFMALDMTGAVIAFTFSNGFRSLLTKGIEKEVTCSLESFSTLQPVLISDMTCHGLYWVEWLAQRPDLDHRNPENDPRLAKSGVYHFGGRCMIGDPSGRDAPFASKDLVSRIQHNSGNPGHVFMQLLNLRYSAFGACTEIVRFFFNLLDPQLLAEYVNVSKEVSKLEIPFATRRSDDPFVMRAALINLMTNEHKDKGDWRHGFAGLVSVGDFEGGDLLLRELGLRIESPPGSIQLRGRELRHSITRWTGRRFVVVSVTHDAVRRWAKRRMGQRVTTGTPSAVDSCLNVNLEDGLPEDQNSEDERERIPERHLDDTETGEEDESQDTDEIPTRRIKKHPKHRNDSTSDADAERSEGDQTGISTKRRRCRERGNSR